MERNGKAEALAASTDLSVVQALRDQDIQDAIDELNRSTEAINQQTETLRQQQDALSRLVSSSSKVGDARSDLEVKRLHKWDSDRKTLNTAVELLSQSLDYRVSELEQQRKGTEDDLTTTIGSMLLSDDKLLSSLQKLGLELDTEDPEETDSVTKLREICARLIKYTVESIRTKLDRVYLEALESFPKSGASREATEEDITAQQEELEELYLEVLPVAQMSVEQQWLEPALRSLSAKNGSSVSRSADALEYVITLSCPRPFISAEPPSDDSQILACFDYLLHRIDRVSDRVSSVKAHEAATTAILAMAKAELSTTVTSAAKRRGTVSSPARRPQSLIMDSMMTPAPSRAEPSFMKTRRRSSGDALHSSPLEQLLGELALSLPDSSSASTSANPSQAQIAYLSHTLTTRTHKCADVDRAVQSTLEHTAAAHLADARKALQLIRDSVLAESPFAEVHLVDPGIEASIGVLAQEAQNIAGRLEGVEREATVLAKGRNIRKEEIVKRWGGRGNVR